MRSVPVMGMVCVVVAGPLPHLGGLQAPSWSSPAPGPACCCAQALTHKATFGFALLLLDASLPTLTPDSLRGLSGLPALTSFPFTMWISAILHRPTESLASGMHACSCCFRQSTQAERLYSEVSLCPPKDAKQGAAWSAHLRCPACYLTLLTGENCPYLTLSSGTVTNTWNVLC